MLARLRFLSILSIALTLAGCANYPYVGADAVPSSDAGMMFNSYRGKIYFGSDRAFNPNAGESTRLLVIAPDAVPFFGQEPILLATDQDGAVTIRTDHTAVTQKAIPDLATLTELTAEYPHCPMPELPVTARLPFFSALKGALASPDRSTR